MNALCLAPLGLRLPPIKLLIALAALNIGKSFSLKSSEDTLLNTFFASLIIPSSLSTIASLSMLNFSTISGVRLFWNNCIFLLSSSALPEIRVPVILPQVLINHLSIVVKPRLPIRLGKNAPPTFGPNITLRGNSASADSPAILDFSPILLMTLTGNSDINISIVSIAPKSDINPLISVNCFCIACDSLPKPTIGNVLWSTLSLDCL